MQKIYAEVGYGNDIFFSTEYEDGDKEYRVPKFVKPTNIESIYIRLWIFKKVYLYCSDEGYKSKQKNKNSFKLLLGLSGT